MAVTTRTFRRKSDEGHASIFSAEVSGRVIVLRFRPHSSPIPLSTTLNKEDAKRFAEWLLSKTERMIDG